MARGKTAERKRFEGVYELVPCRWCGAEVIWVRKHALDPVWVPYVSPPIPHAPMRIVYSFNGWDEPATAGEDIPDYVEDVHYGFLAHECRRASAATEEYEQGKLPDWI